MTPLIDIVLVLLIIFMVMTPVMLKELSAAVPRKATEENVAPPGNPPIVVRLDAAGALTVSGEPVAPEALAARIAERLVHDRKKIVFFDVDDAANYGRAVKLMDICKGAGAKVLGIVTKD
ncbi:MAG: biopolymer transporter ExbD [Deltaproteobacteria bacterium]|nr:biopolymer transporter ExbD [Deltaproteobacteria bacterium]